MVVGMVADMVADIEVDKVADKVADMAAENKLSWRLHKNEVDVCMNNKCIGQKLFDAKCMSSKLCEFILFAPSPSRKPGMGQISSKETAQPQNFSRKAKNYICM